MANPWAGYAAVNDDVRHTYERVFYGRQLTGNLTENDMPGINAGQPAREAGQGVGTEVTDSSPAAALYGPAEARAEPSHPERQATADAWHHAENAPGIRREIETAEGRPYMHTDAPDRVARGSVHGPADSQVADAGNVWGKEPAEAPASAPAIEPPSSPAAPDNDMTPG